VIAKSKPSYVRVCKFSDSTTIQEVSYDFSRKAMKVYFISTQSIWEYYDVWPADFAAMCCAYSPGQVFNERIRNRFESKRIHPPAEPTQTTVQFNVPD